ncbi:hypothetical protein L249_5043 [Ophiocordyceps polyrhachis-furcata BCC 54312]|uniref:methionyl-tRNA formyltransferase n=1 Tax=Ophiocordyceps polyrhachis-furcata BCC 54312 TaxID=1330021 RepID=A0A367L3W3_9HYPO|nr:hypothetical protein L249_5043 [Ophiocordyceps polyrhachis-furcata BCC 54312]
MASSSDGWDERHPVSTQQQPVFLTAPRFITSTEPIDRLPRRRPRGNNAYLPGGLAATLQEALSEVKGKADAAAAAEKDDDEEEGEEDAIHVDELNSPAMVLLYSARTLFPCLVRAGRRRFESTTTRASDPLRILFCGSDAFSCESLRALHRELGSGAVEALDVMVLPPKRMGRGMKQLRQVPCRALAEELRLTVHERETFTKWEVPLGTNLIVVVSFGLFVPPRVLKSAKYGGVNVHPSFLPDLRGPAPIHHALLRGDRHIGVSLQTLDEKRFDHGVVLAQTPPPGLVVPSAATIQEVTALAAKQGAEMLVRALLRDRLHVPPHRDAGWGWKAVESENGAGGLLRHAPKVTKADSRIDWRTWTSGEEFGRRVRVFGTVWTKALDLVAKKRRRIIFKSVQAVDGDHDVDTLFAGPRGRVCFDENGEEQDDGLEQGGGERRVGDGCEV